MVSKILEDSIQRLTKFYTKEQPDEALHVTQVVYGLSAVGVALSNGGYGTCFGAVGEAEPRQAMVWNRAGSLTDIPVWELVQWAQADHIYDRAIGIATLNALTSIYIRARHFITRDTILLPDALSVKENDDVGIVGYMESVIRRFQDAGANVIVVDKDPTILAASKHNHLLTTVFPNSKALKGVQHLVTTAASLVYHSFHEIITDIGGPCSIALIGPSAGLPPDILFQHNIAVIGRQEFTDRSRAFQVLQEGGLPGSKNQSARKSWILARDNLHLG